MFPNLLSQARKLTELRSGIHHKTTIRVRKVISAAKYVEYCSRFHSDVLRRAHSDRAISDPRHIVLTAAR